MINLKTNLSFGISLERKHRVEMTKETKSISKLFVIVKEVIRKRLLKS